MPRTAKTFTKERTSVGKQDIRLARKKTEILNMLLYMREVIPRLRNYS